RLFDKFVHTARAIEQGILGVQMQMDKVSVRHDDNLASCGGNTKRQSFCVSTPMPVMQNLELRLVADFFGQFKLVLERWEKGVAFHLAFHQRQIKIGTQRQGLFINLGTAGDEKFQRRTRRVQFQKILDNAQIHRGRAADFGQKLCRLVLPPQEAKLSSCRTLTLSICICTPSIPCSMARAVWTNLSKRRIDR